MTNAQNPDYTAGQADERKRVESILAHPNALPQFQLTKTLIVQGQQAALARSMLSTVLLSNQNDSQANQFMQHIKNVATEQKPDLEDV